MAPQLVFGLRTLRFGLLFCVFYLLVMSMAVNAQPGGVMGLRFTNIPPVAPTFGGQSSYMFEELRSIDDVDVVWIGSSHAYRTFDPRFFADRGVSTFNMGTSGQTPINTYFLIDHFLDDVRPRAVVMEVYWNVLTWDGVESTLDIVANGVPAPWILRMAVATRDIRAVNSFIRRLVDIRRPQLEEVQPTLFVGDTYVDRGFVEKDPAFVGDRTWPQGHLDVRARQLLYLERTVDLVVKRGIPLLLITQPLPQSTLDAITNESDLYASVEEIADRHDVPYVDFNGLVALDDTADFFDAHHLSQRGVLKFLPAVYDKMVEWGLISAR